MVNHDDKTRIPLNLLKDNGGSIKGKTRFQKMIFLAEKEEGLREAFEFEKYNYGPYSFELSDKLSSLENLGFLEIEKKEFPSADSFEGKEFIYSLTDKGEEAVGDLDDSDSKALQKVADKWNSSESSLQELIDYVYDKYM